jgi:hypothetical protein
MSIKPTASDREDEPLPMTHEPEGGAYFQREMSLSEGGSLGSLGMIVTLKTSNVSTLDEIRVFLDGGHLNLC